MGVVVLKLRVFGCWAFVCSLLVHGSAASPIGEGTLSNMSNSSTLIDTAPTPVTQPSGSVPPLITTPPPDFTPAPQTTRYFPLSSPSTAPENAFVPPPTPVQGFVPTTPPAPQFVVRAPEPATSPSSEQSQPPNPRQTDTAPVNNAPIFTPVSNGPPPLELPEPALPSSSVSPEEPPTPSPDVYSHPSLPRNSQPIVNEPPSSPPEKNASPILAPPPTISKTPDATVPRAEPSNRNKTASVSYSPTEAPNTSNRPRDPNSAPPPRLFSKSAESHSPNAPPILAPPPTVSNTPVATVPRAASPNRNKTAPVSYSPTEDPNTTNRPMHPNTAPPPQLFSKSAKSHSPRNSHRARVYNIAPAPEMHEVPPPSSGSSTSASPIPPKPIPFDVEYAPMPTPDSSSWQAKFPFASPKLSPSGPSPRTPKSPLSPPILALPPPPPHKGCAPMTCTDPLTYGPPQSPCSCVIPIQVGLRLSIALLTFFPLVSELASEIAYGVYMMQSQVRIMGANAAEDNPDKTVVLIDLLPNKDRFDDTTSIITFKRFWLKQVVINKSVFGDYDVLYVRYPGLPPSPPLPPSTIGMIASNPYPDRNNPRTVQPLGVDVSGKQQKRGLSGSIVAIIIISCFAAVLLLSSVAWVFLFRYGHCDSQPGPTPPATIPSLAKSSGMPVTIVGSGTSSPPFSLVSSIAAYTGSAKTFSSSEIEKATDSFNETRVIGEGGFGRVYSGVLEDGMKVAVKILKRYDQQGGREFLAEVEMLSRLHHRNLVKLIGICVDDHTRCLVYELITNGSVDSHLHGCDKERCPLDWSARLKIALGAARALAYLHEDSSPRVIHRDFKASNILLEDDFTPKVSDFGLARTGLDEENRHISTRVMGTFGYVAPEYAMTGHLLVKSDVYSYGVVLLELLTGRKPVDMSQPPGEENLVSWARPLLTSSQGLESIVDQSLISDSSSSLDSISKVAAIASMCVQPEVSHRPFMGEVVQALRLVCNECDGTKEESPSRSCSQEDFSIVMEIRDDINSGRFPGPLLSPSTFSDYDFRDDGERDLSMSELLSPTEKFGGKDSESFRRHSSSGPLRTGKGKPLWKTMRQLSRGSMSEHGVPFRLWPGSH